LVPEIITAYLKRIRAINQKRQVLYSRESDKLFAYTQRPSLARKQDGERQRERERWRWETEMGEMGIER
jgi:hypothetical protein